MTISYDPRAAELQRRRAQTNHARSLLQAPERKTAFFGAMLAAAITAGLAVGLFLVNGVF